MAKQLSLTPQVRKLLSKGIAHQQAGRLGSAEACYRRSLKADPRCPQALRLLGLVAQSEGRSQDSIRLIRESLALNPDDPDALNSLADSYFAQGEMQPASRCLVRLAELRPQSADVHHRLGKLQERLGEWDAATASYRRALALKPDSPGLHSSLAGLESKQGALREALDSCGRALALDPTNPELYTQLGSALTDLGEYEAALKALERALALQPKSTSAVLGMGYVFERRGDLAAAANAFRDALKLDPKSASAYLHLSIIYNLEADLANAAGYCKRVLELEPGCAEARSFLGLIDLVQGNYLDGWTQYEERWNTPYGFRFRRKFEAPRWKGEPLEGSRILLYAEQGLGDTLQFVRYVPVVAALGANVFLEVQPCLQGLLARTPGATDVISCGAPLPAFDWQCPLLSLPWALGTSLDTIPAQVPYVYADPSRVERWQQRLFPAQELARARGNALRVGLVWAGSSSHPNDLWRSISLEQLAPLTNIEAATFYSLQVGAPAEQVKLLGARARLIDLHDELKEFEDTAAIIANLDLVISIDTSVAHLAGAMGKAVWILLQKSNDWRWLLGREDSPWYPTARLFRQSKLGEWQEVMTRVEEELRKLAAQKPRT